MSTAKRIKEKLSAERIPTIELSDEPTRDELRDVVLAYKREGLCGRRIGQQYLGPYFIASEEYGQREIDLLEEILAEEYDGTNLCVKRRSSECRRFRGGCKNSR